MTDKEARAYIQIMFNTYKEKNFKNKENKKFAILIIDAYINYVKKPKFSIIVDKYKEEYIHNEARVEKNTKKEEKEGLGIVYDYISNFNFEKDNFNIFTTSLILHSKLYSKCPNPSFGGKLRDINAYLEGTNIELLNPEETRRIFNSMIQTSNNIFISLNEGNILKYIDDCIITTTNLIKLQPFCDGNKRTFRAILNLLLKKINIPPIYIEKYERPIYKEALLEAIEKNNYEKIIGFYHFKICDSIMKLDIKKSMITVDENKEHTHILKKIKRHHY